jgi:tetratricopeptide (TPR) repeat protein
MLNRFSKHPVAAALAAALWGVVPSSIAQAEGGAAEAVPAIAPAELGAQQLARGSSAEAAQSLSSALNDAGLSNDRRATLLNDRGVAYMRLGQVKLAIEDFNKAAQLFPELAAIYNNRGNLLLSLGLTREAIKDFDRAIVLAPGYAAAYNNRASAQAKTGQLQDAIKDYSKAIQLMPQSPAPLSGRGRVNLQLARPHAAIRDFTRAVAADARFASGYRNRAEAQLAVEQFDAAIEDLSRAAAFDANNAEIYLVRGDAYLAMRNIPAALKDFSQAITLDPKLGPAYEGRGLAHGLSEAFDESFADLNKAIEIDPRSAVAFAYRAFVYKQNGQLDVAQKDLETAGKLGERKAEVYWARAELEEAQGQTDAAIQHLRKALAVKPGYKMADESLVRLAGPDAGSQEVVVPGVGVDLWRVVERSGRYMALNEQFPRLSVPLEMLGEGKPRLIAWEIKPPPVEGVGVLKFYGGAVKTKSGTEEVELAALIDLVEGRVLTVEPEKQGNRTAQWTWEPGRVIIASVDGVTDEFPLRSSPASLTGAAGDGLTRRYSGTGTPGAAWAPWDQPWAGGMGPPPDQVRTQRSVVKKKSKTLFDLLFN